MILAHHLIMTAYGWWLPNDPRGSSSHEIRVEPVAELGELHHGRKLIQPLSRELHDFYTAAEGILRHELLLFNDSEISTIAEAFADVIATRRYTCYACVIMPDHVHLLIRRHRDSAEEMTRQFQAVSSRHLRLSGHRRPDHPVWGGPGWKVFVDSPAQMVRTIQYIEDNPLKIHRPVQQWGFVKPYEGWDPGLR